MFKVFRNGDHEHVSHVNLLRKKTINKGRSNDTQSGEEIYSIRNLMDKEKYFCDDKIFEILNQQDPTGQRFKYVHFKIKKIKEREI
jgi:hypothetical protein